MTKQTDLEHLFIETICTETAGDLDPVTCACGTHKALGVKKYGVFIGAMIVEGCMGPDGTGCPVASRMGNLAWEYRHPFARFIRALSDKMLEDREQLLGTLPTEVGNS